MLKVMSLVIENVSNGIMVTRRLKIQWGGFERGKGPLFLGFIAFLLSSFVKIFLVGFLFFSPEPPPPTFLSASVNGISVLIKPFGSICHFRLMQQQPNAQKQIQQATETETNNNKIFLMFWKTL